MKLADALVGIVALIVGVFLFVGAITAVAWIVTLALGVAAFQVFG